jgi:Ca2+-binding RTX toxin-like protein
MYEFSSRYETKFETAMAEWSSVANIDFQKTNNLFAADWLIGWGPAPDGRYGVLGWNYNLDRDQDGWLETGEGDRSFIAMDWWDTRYFDAVAVHEAGHALGLGHNNAESSIMTTYIGSLDAPTEADIAAVQDLYGARDVVVAEEEVTAVATVQTGDQYLVQQNSGGRMDGGDGNDTMVGGIFTDVMYAGGGNDSMEGNTWNDWLYGEAGADTIIGGSGNDRLYGNKGLDSIEGGSGNDIIYGGQNSGDPSGDPGALRDGVETLSGGVGDDLIYGNYGSDSIDGGSSDDTIYGGQDDDTIIGGSGYDRLYGDLGADSFVYSTKYQDSDWIYDYEPGEDRVVLLVVKP